MDGILTTLNVSLKDTCESQVSDAKNIGVNFTTRLPQHVTTLEEALEVLRNKPDYPSLVTTLEYLSQEDSLRSLYLPTPTSSQLVHVLVSETIPTYWHALSDPENVRGLRKDNQSMTGINSIVLNLKQFIQLAKESTKKVHPGSSAQEVLKILLSLLETLLEGENTIEKIWSNMSNVSDDPAMRNILWTQFQNTFGGNKIIGIFAEAEKLSKPSNSCVDQNYWVSDGKKYCLWLASNITSWSRSSANSEITLKRCADILGKSLSLGCSDTVIKQVVTKLLLQEDECSELFSSILANLSVFGQRKVLFETIRISSRDFFRKELAKTEYSKWWITDAASVSAVAAMVQKIISKDEKRKVHIIEWLTSSVGAGVGDGIAIRRSVLAAVSSDKDCIETIFERSMQQFGDNLYIRHTPTLQQEVHCQVLLLAAGYLYRQSPLGLKMMMRTGANLSVISNRLASSSNRIRFLGMVVGEALSSLVDSDCNKMEFKVEEMTTHETEWYKSLVYVLDSVGSIKKLNLQPNSYDYNQIQPQKLGALKATKTLSRASSKIVAIEEVMINRLNPEDDDLTPYIKPDSDAEDSDDDPTVIDRNKPISPVYVRDLISYLRDSESYEHQKLGLNAAASLIRRKANFGSEITDHAEELAALLVGIQDKYEIENFSEMRLQSMIALIIALPLKMGQWFSKTFFEGDYSISQRSAVLTALGLGAREIGGFGEEDALLSSNKTPMFSFPSKMLPISMQENFGSRKVDQVGALSNQLANTMIEPMATSLADKLTGPSILKIRKFSSRVEVERKRRKPSPNLLAKIVADGFLFPMTGRFLSCQHSSTMSARSVIFQPFLLSHFIKTISLVLHAAGPFAISLPQMTIEFWDLLLGLRVTAQNERIVCEALCFSILTILELNLENSTLQQIHGRRLSETYEWVMIVFGALGQGEEDERCRMIAAGCLVRIQEIQEMYRKTLLGLD
ncbi:BgTH12-05874 [Blumeria graminis f. sp. triticale]|uniref:Bgt-240 n=3 Tax=Blumeria graminis TaxID=34373 RepID=A0A061HJW4_BLUGR|nr:hypothetical protein BGT96224_240 [Blumeria graminis f. sp. tritici 96224]CAD6504137.1 BgTH12-05874 [Blumeria graminis f. sp. triticale]VDB90904.1 Bgt-240 [Blumeria graminis f. sp. tritici]